MKLKELTVKEALLLLAEKYPEPVEGWFWYDKDDEKDNGCLLVDTYNHKHPFRKIGIGNYPHFAVKTPDEYRYMTQQECLNWVCLHGHKGYQAHHIIGSLWKPMSSFVYELPGDFEYRTVQEIDGEIVYGEPQEFKVRLV